MKNFLLAFTLILLTACGSTTVPIRSVTYQTIMPPDTFFVCNKPDIELGQLTDLQVALLLIRYEEEITTCQNNLIAIRQFLREAVAPITAPVT